MKKFIAAMLATLILMCALPALADEGSSWYSAGDGLVSIELTQGDGLNWQPFICLLYTSDAADE